jgi:hypothetical protein
LKKLVPIILPQALVLYVFVEFVLWSAFGQPLISNLSAFGQPLVNRTRGNN